ncbi:hypothetical protein GCM10010174_09200 [Kutzneria viridogrisea]|uniref:Uncharacterized protein n=2 Tax=Kutzneria TaxID=43356 RepID=W5WLM8_9PSEU|nr:hypothetical protein [Kutzneria albida]AHI01477.1 hypothetical protein KALB_8119 [Kutzneria albida DSM 43870]MBA8931441.1 hypothetical protein [Kutzneria viridogrisea]
MTVLDWTAPVITIGEPVSAIGMRAGLGAEVNALLSIAMLSGPVLAYTGSPERWVFLTGPATAISHTVLGDLVRMRVVLFSTGSLLALPSAHDGGIVRWVSAPREDRPLPPWQAVVAAARRTCSVSSGWS